MLKVKFISTNYQEFWLSIGEEYIDLKTKAIQKLVQFPSTYLCETGVSKLVCIKTKNRVRLDPENNPRIAISKIKADLERIMSTLQYQASH